MRPPVDASCEVIGWVLQGTGQANRLSESTPKLALQSDLLHLPLYVLVSGSQAKLTIAGLFLAYEVRHSQGRRPPISVIRKTAVIHKNSQTLTQ